MEDFLGRPNHIDEPANDWVQRERPRFMDRLIYWSLLLASSILSVLGLWKLAELVLGI